MVSGSQDGHKGWRSSVSSCWPSAPVEYLQTKVFLGGLVW